MSEASYPRAWDCSDEEYHADREHVSNSMLGDFIKDPALYYGRYVTGEFPREESTAFDIGTVFHDMVLGAYDGGCKYCVIPDDVLAADGSKRGKKWEQWRDEHAGNVLLKEADFLVCRLMVDALQKNKTARWLLEQRHRAEHAILFIDEATEIPLRSKLDHLADDLSFIVDLKSTISSNPKSFSDAACRFGYHRQAAFYQDAVLALYGQNVPFVFIVQEKTPPYSCRVIELDKGFVDRGRTAKNNALRDMQKCILDNLWDVPGGDRIITVAEPRWAKYMDEYLVTAE